MDKNNVVEFDRVIDRDFFDKPILNKINGLIFCYCQEEKKKESEVWDEICSEFRYRHCINIKLRAKNRGMKVLDLVEDMDKMDELFAVATVICVDRG